MSPVPDPNDNPDKQNESDISSVPLDVPPFITMSSSSDSEDEEDDENDLHGYQQLPQEPEAGGDDGANVTPSTSEVMVDDVIRHELSGVDTGLGFNSPSLASTLGLPEEGLPVTESVWKGDALRRDSGPLEQEQAEKIKAAMAGFKLPESQTPQWAKDIPEDVWKSQLKARLNLPENKDS